MDFTITKLPRVGSKAYQQEKAAERAAKLKQEEQALKQARIKAGVPDPLPIHVVMIESWDLFTAPSASASAFFAWPEPWLGLAWPGAVDDVSSS